MCVCDPKAPLLSWLSVKQMDPSCQYVVFSGGGQRGLAYIGAIMALESLGFTADQLRGAAGASAGALMAILVLVGFTGAELYSLGMSIDIRQFWRPRLVNLLFKGGLDDRSYLTTFVSQCIRMKLGPPPSGDTWTFGQLQEHHGKAFVTTVTDLCTCDTLYCSPATTPDWSLADAVTTSMAFPIVFCKNPCIWPATGEDVELVDGGMSDNFPIDVFPATKTLGFRVRWSRCAGEGLGRPDRLIARVAYCLLSRNLSAQETTGAGNTINIEVGDMPTLEPSISDAFKNDIVSRGCAVTLEALSAAAKMPSPTK